MIEEKIKNLIGVELDILGFNQELCNLEKINGQNSNIFENISNIYLQAVNSEEKLLSKLSDKEASEIEDYLMDSKRNEKIFAYLREKNPSYNSIFVVVRIINRLEEKTMPEVNVINFGNLKLDSKIENVISETRKIVLTIKSAISSEYADIYLSFLDEYIKKASDIEKKDLIDEKYNVIYTTGNSHEKELIKRNFITEYSLYLASELSCVTKNKNYYNVYTSFRNFYINSHLNSLLQELIEINNKTNTEILILLLKLRAYLIMIDNNNYKRIITELSQLDSNVFASLFDSKGKAFDTLKKDKQRHKVLKLKI